MTGITRRSILAHGGLLAGVATSSAIGWSAARGDMSARPLTQLHVASLRILGSRRPTTIGEARIVQGPVQLRRGGVTVGVLHVTSTVIAAPDLLDPQDGYLETQLFTLQHGTIAGLGTVHHDGTGRFTITGSTGAYAQLRGGYTSTQFADHSGLGSATFSFETENPWRPALT